MSEETGKAPGHEPRDVPFGQIVFDNLFLWVALGVALPLLSYIVWGLLDIGSTPVEALAAPGVVVSPTQAPPQNAKVVRVTLGDFWIQSAVTTFEQGVPYRFEVTNSGATVHEFMVAPPMPAAGMSMEEMDQMALGLIASVAPAATMTVDVTFDQPYPTGALEFSCHVPGHYEAGMRLPIVVG